jgi:carbamoyltransferase
MEFGPRALGHRSILAHPGSLPLRDRVNRIKRRAGFRPFAPAVAARDASIYFDGAGDPFMNRALRVRAQHRQRLAGVTHADGSARVQIVHPDHGAFADLLDAVGRETGMPVLLNTSFNLKGAPIIRTARQAIDAFHSLPLDALALADTLIVRKGSPADAQPIPAVAARASR